MLNLVFTSSITAAISRTRNNVCFACARTHRTTQFGAQFGARAPVLFGARAQNRAIWRNSALVLYYLN